MYNSEFFYENASIPSVTLSKCRSAGRRVVFAHGNQLSTPHPEARLRRCPCRNEAVWTAPTARGECGTRGGSWKPAASSDRWNRLTGTDSGSLWGLGHGQRLPGPEHRGVSSQCLPSAPGSLGTCLAPASTGTAIGFDGLRLSLPFTVRPAPEAGHSVSVCSAVLEPC